MYDNCHKNQVILLEAMRSVFSPGFAAIRSLLPVLGTIRQIDFSFCKYSSRYDHFKEGSSKTLSILRFPTLPDGHRRLLCPSARLPVWHAGFDSEQQHFFIQRLRRRRHGSFTVHGYAATLRYSKISDSYLPSQIQGEAATLLIDKIQDPQQLTLLFRDGHTENPNIPAVSNNMVYEAAEFARLIDQLQQALENDSTDGIPSLIRHSWPESILPRARNHGHRPQATKNSFSGRPLRSAVFIHDNRMLAERAFYCFGKSFLRHKQR